MLITQTINGVDYSIDVRSWTDQDSINFDDFNRIERNIKTTRDYLQAIQYIIPSIATVTDRTKMFIDFLSSINRIEQNLETLRTNFATPPSYHGAAAWVRRKGFDDKEANRLEENIRLLFVTAGEVFNGFVYCGTTSAGHGRGDLVAL